MKCTSREAALQRYGGIDLHAKYWPASGQWLQTIDVREFAFPWHVEETKIPVTHITCNFDMKDPLLGALNAIRDQKLGQFIKSYDGCFNIRAVRGTNNAVSAHSYGLAIDINANENALGSVAGGFYDLPQVVKCFTDQGFDWGGKFLSRKDPMHFSYCWE